MKVIRNNIIPFPGFKAINIFGILFVRNDARINYTTINHECIHTKQMKELLYIFFYLWYFIEWLIRLFMKGNAYRNISFEREAYSCQYDDSYLKFRKRWAFVHFLKNPRKYYK